MKNLAMMFVVSIAIVGLSIRLVAEELPFALTLGGAKPVAGTSFATVPGTVADNAELVLDVDEPMVIINVFPCNEKGEAKEGASPAIIMIQGGKKITIDQTMDKKKLSVGNYIMNIVAGGKTARVMFSVK